jgi:hypothetical protein
LRQAGGGEEALHRILVHGGGGAEDTGADVGDVGKFEEALNGAVLAEGSVQDGEDDVELRGEGVDGMGELGAGVELEGLGQVRVRRQPRDAQGLTAAQDGGGGGELGFVAWGGGCGGGDGGELGGGRAEQALGF